MATYLLSNQEGALQLLERLGENSLFWEHHHWTLDTEREASRQNNSSLEGSKASLQGPHKKHGLENLEEYKIQSVK